MRCYFHYSGKMEEEVVGYCVELCNILERISDKEGRYTSRHKYLHLQTSTLELTDEFFVRLKREWPTRIWDFIIASICEALPSNEWLRTVVIDTSLIKDSTPASCLAKFIVENKDLREIHLENLENCPRRYMLEDALLARPVLLERFDMLRTTTMASALQRIDGSLLVSNAACFMTVINLIANGAAVKSNTQEMPCIVFGSSANMKTRQLSGTVTSTMLEALVFYFHTGAFYHSQTKVTIHVFRKMQSSAKLMAQFMYYPNGTSVKHAQYELKFCIDNQQDLAMLLDCMSYTRLQVHRLGSFMWTSLQSVRSTIQLRKMRISLKKMTPYVWNALLGILSSPQCALQVIKTIPFEADDYCYELMLHDVLKQNNSVCQISWGNGEHFISDFFCLRNKYQLRDARLCNDTALWMEALFKCFNTTSSAHTVPLLYYFLHKHPHLLLVMLS